MALHALLAHLWIWGTPVLWYLLCNERLVQPFVAARHCSFIVNPCERNVDHSEALPVAQESMCFTR
jgi:hypothetical protein